MGKLLRFEWRKILKQRYLPFFVGLLLVLNVFNIYENYDVLLTPSDVFYYEGVPESADRQIYQIQHDFEGAITAEKVSELQARNARARELWQNGNDFWDEGYFRRPGGDYYAGQKLLTEMERLYAYDENVRDPLLAKNAELLAAAKADGDVFRVRAAEKTEALFMGRALTDYYRVDEYRSLLTYKLSTLFLLLLGIYAASFLFAGEKEAAMLSLQKSARRGKTALFFAKVTALGLFLFVLGLLFFVGDYLTFFFCRRFSGAFMPVYAIKDFAFSPVNVPVFEFYCLLSFFKIWGVFLVCLTAILFSVLLRRSVFAFLWSLLTSVGLMTLTLFTDGVFSVVRYLNPVSLLIAVRFFETLRFENVLGFPIQPMTLMVFGTAAAAFLLLGAALIRYKKGNAYA